MFLDGKRIFGPALKYVFLSTDGIEKPKWFGVAGPIYRKLRVYTK